MRVLLETADDFVLGRIRAEDLPMIAAEALTRGIDTTALCELAGLGRSEPRESTDLFTQVMIELGRPLRGRQVVLWDRARQIALDLLAGRRGAAEAVGELAAMLCDAGHLDEHGDCCDLATRFELLSVNWDDMPEERDRLDADIRTAAHELLERYP